MTHPEVVDRTTAETPATIAQDDAESEKEAENVKEKAQEPAGAATAEPEDKATAAVDGKEKAPAADAEAKVDPEEVTETTDGEDKAEAAKAEAEAKDDSQDQADMEVMQIECARAEDDKPYEHKLKTATAKEKPSQGDEAAPAGAGAAAAAARPWAWTQQRVYPRPVHDLDINCHDCRHKIRQLNRQHEAEASALKKQYIIEERDYEILPKHVKWKTMTELRDMYDRCYAREGMKRRRRYMEERKKIVLACHCDTYYTPTEDPEDTDTPEVMAAALRKYRRRDL